MKPMLAALLMLCLQRGPAAPVAAAPDTPSLKATLRLSVARVDAPPPATPNPYAGLGALLMRMLTPEGPVDITYFVSGDAMRAEIDGRVAALPRGTIVLQHVGDSTLRVLNPVQKTWYELPASIALGAQLGAPDVVVEPTGEHATIAGQRADRFRFSERLDVPSPEGINMPQDFPKEITLSGDLWTTDAFAGDAYKGIFKTLQAFAPVPGLEALMAGGRFPLRLQLHSDIMAGYELRTDVTAIVPMTVPADYQKVQAPGGQ
jgi:hypothetical protein